MIPAEFFNLAVGLSLLAVLAYLGSCVTVQPKVRTAALCIAWLTHGAVLLLKLTTHPPHFGFAPALSITVWLVLTVYAIEHSLYPQIQSHRALAAFGAGTVALAGVYPGTAMHALVHPWLPLHWALGIASYGLIAAAVVHAWLMTRAEQRLRQAAQTQVGLPIMTLERLTFRFVWAGFLLLTATLLAGWWFRDTHLARLRWDHKTALSVLSWLTFAALLFGRTRLGWRGRKAVRFLYTGSALLLLAYVGSRFVLEVLLGRAA